MREIKLTRTDDVNGSQAYETSVVKTEADIPNLHALPKEKLFQLWNNEYAYLKATGELLLGIDALEYVADKEK